MYPNFEAVTPGLAWLFRQEQSCFDPSLRIRGRTLIMALMNTDDLFYTQKKVELLNVMVKLGVDIDAQDIGSNDCNTIGFSALHYTYYYRSYVTRAHFQRCIQSLKEVWGHFWRLGANFHLFGAQGHTSTSLALILGPECFCPWRETVLKLKKCTEFVRDELNNRSFLFNKNWNGPSLRYHFCEGYTVLSSRIS